MNMVMRAIRVVIAVLAVFVLLGENANFALAQSNTWTGGYPKAGTTPGSILVKGKATKSQGWNLVTNAVVNIWPVGGGLMIQRNIGVNVTSGEWGEEELENVPYQGQEVWVTVVATQAAEGQAPVGIATDSAKVKILKAQEPPPPGG